MAAPSGLRLPLPSLESKKDPNKLKQYSSGRRRRVGAIETVQGIAEVTLLRPPIILVLGVRAFQTRLGGGVQLQETDETGAKVIVEEGLQKKLRRGRA